MNDTVKDEIVDPNLGPDAVDPNAQPETVDDIQPPKKRRGRPPKSERLEEQSTSSAQSTPKRTYTKKATNNRPTFDSDSTLKLAKQIAGIHLMVASMTQLGELQINDTEAMMLAQSIQTVSAEYDLSLSGKTGAFLQLMATAAMVYVPRVLVINAKIKAAKNKAPVDVVDNLAQNHG